MVVCAFLFEWVKPSWQRERQKYNKITEEEKKIRIKIEIEREKKNRSQWQTKQENRHDIHKKTLKLNGEKGVKADFQLIIVEMKKKKK